MSVRERWGFEGVKGVRVREEAAKEKAPEERHAGGFTGAEGAERFKKKVVVVDIMVRSCLGLFDGPCF